MEQLTKFIEDNKLTFANGSGGDSNILALCGYATFIGATAEDCIKAVKNTDCNDEIERIHKYATNHSYANFWTLESTKSQYKF